MKKKHNKRLIFSRFTVIALSIILQAAAIWTGIWIGINKLGSYWHWIWIATYVTGGILLVSLINKETAAVYKLPWIILCLAFPYAGAMCYLTFGNVHLSRRMRKKFSAVYHEKDDGYYEQERSLKRRAAICRHVQIPSGRYVFTRVRRLRYRISAVGRKVLRRTQKSPFVRRKVYLYRIFYRSGRRNVGRRA